MNEKNLINLINNLRKYPSNCNNFSKILKDKNLTQKNTFLNEKNLKNILELIKELNLKNHLKLKKN